MISESCPTWCVAEHREPGERHRSTASTVPVVLRDADAPAAVELVVELHRSDDEPLSWCYIGEGSLQHLELSAESAWRLGHELLATLRRQGAAPR